MPPRTIDEAARRTPVVQEIDVVVAGGGPAGIAAALAAARHGASVRLIEMHGQLGGIWTTGLLAWVLDSHNKSGLLAELFARLDARGARGYEGHGHGIAFDVEQMKLVLEQMCLDAGVQVRLHTRVAAAARDEADRLAVAITESKSGREAFAAKVFVDCTGDGDLAAMAGCGFDVGRPAGDGVGEAGETQPMSLVALLGGVHYPDLVEAGFARAEGVVGRSEAGHNLRQHLAALGAEPSYGNPSLFAIRDDLVMCMSNHEYGRSGLCAQDLTDATLHARREIHEQVDALRRGGGVFANVRIVATGAQIGVREARRIHGRVQPYDIPFRSLIARDVDGLLLAGRCISGDFLAHSSYRVTGNAVALGEAAGTAAGLAARLDRLPHQLDFQQDIRPHWDPPIVDAAVRKDYPTQAEAPASPGKP